MRPSAHLLGSGSLGQLASSAYSGVTGACDAGVAAVETPIETAIETTTVITAVGTASNVDMIFTEIPDCPCFAKSAPPAGGRPQARAEK